jgi:hypothetical protein
MARPVAYGQAYGPRVIVPIPFPHITTSAANFYADSGKFVAIKSNTGYGFLASNNTWGGAQGCLFGWAEVGTFATPTDTGSNIIAVNIANDAVFEMPIVSALSESLCKSMVSRLCELEIIGGKQYANYDAATGVALVQIVGYKYYGSAVGEQSLLVRLGADTRSYTCVT